MGVLSGKVALVTGASRGLGKDIAMALAREGASIVVIARTEAEGQSHIPGTLAQTEALIKDAGGQAIAIRADVTSEDEVAAAVRQAVEAFGRIDILVNNAGVLIPGSVMEMQLRHWNLALRVNLTGPFLFCRAALPHLIAAGGGHIVNISSRGATGPGAGPYERVAAGGTSYGTTKAALERFSQGLAAEVFPQRISVNALSPYRPIWSEGGHFFRSQSGEPEYSGWRRSGAIFGDAVVLICTQEPGTYTGNVLYDELLMQKEGGLSEDEVFRRYPVEP